MNKIPTVEEFLVKSDVFSKPEISNFNLVLHRDAHMQAQRNIKHAMIEFAKLHVEAALNAASESKSLCTAYTDDGLDYKENILCKESVLNAYPLKNIK
jgi:hypothetical protein